MNDRISERGSSDGGPRTILLIATASVFRDPAAMAVRKDAMWAAVDQIGFANLDAGVVPAGAAIANYPFEVRTESWILAITEPGSQTELARQLLESTAAALPPGSSFVFEHYGARSGLGVAA